MRDNDNDGVAINKVKIKEINTKCENNHLKTHIINRDTGLMFNIK